MRVAWLSCLHASWIGHYVDFMGLLPRQNWLRDLLLFLFSSPFLLLLTCRQSIESLGFNEAHPSAFNKASNELACTLFQTLLAVIPIPCSYLADRVSSRAGGLDFSVNVSMSDHSTFERLNMPTHQGSGLATPAWFANLSPIASSRPLGPSSPLPALSTLFCFLSSGVLQGALQHMMAVKKQSNLQGRMI